MTPKLIKDHGISETEYSKILEILGHPPNLTELGIFSAMWNEHCSYKSSKKWLRQLPTKGDKVICGPGENAGIIDIGDGEAAVFKWRVTTIQVILSHFKVQLLVLEAY